LDLLHSAKALPYSECSIKSAGREPATNPSR
jgi:hypothetical protein